MARRDVELVIRAKNEASKAIEQASGALADLAKAQKDTATSAAPAASLLGQLGQSIGELNSQIQGLKAFDRIAGQLNKAKDAVARLDAEAQASKTAMTELDASYAKATARASELRAEVNRLAKELQGQSLAKAKKDGDAAVASYREQRAALSSLREELRKANAEQRSLGSKRDNAAVSVETNNSALEKARAELSGLEDIAKRASAALGGLSIDPKVASTALKTAQAQAELAKEAEAVRLATFPTIAAVQKYEQQLARLDVLQEAGVLDAKTYAARQAQLRAEMLAATGATKQAAQSQGDLAKRAEAVRLATYPNIEITRKYKQELAGLRELMKAGAISTELFTARQKQLRAQAEQTFAALKRQQTAQGNGGSGGPGKPALFGLKPYELQNLGYQVNDFFTQLGSGTSVMQALAQQGGQVIQLFPNLGARIIPLIPAFAALAAAIAPFVLGLRRIVETESSLRTFSGQLALSADGANYQSTQLLAAARALDTYGASAADAQSAISTFVKAGIDSSALVAFGKAAQDLSDIMGIEVPEAAKQLAAGFDGTYKSIAELDNSLNFLTADQRENIQTMFEQGKQADALEEAFRLLNDRLEDGANKANGPWTRAIRALSGAWDSFLDLLSNLTVVREMANALEGLANTARRAANWLNGVRAIEDVDAEIKTVKSMMEVNELYQKDAKRKLDVANNLNARLSALQKERAGIIGETEAEVARIREESNQADQKAANDYVRSREKEIAADRRAGQAATNEQKARIVYDREYNAAIAARVDATRAAELANAAYRVELDRLNKAEADRAKRQREGNDALKQTVDLLKQQEGFSRKAYWDVNAYRAGFGSDTVTRANGRVEKVTANTTVSLEDALRDLARRIPEFVNTIKGQIGSARYNDFNAQQQAALTSIAYNYGSLPERLVKVIKTGTVGEIADAIRKLGGDNGGVNRKRRNTEADLFSVPNSAVDQGGSEAAAKLVEEQQKLNAAIAQGNADLEISIDNREALYGLVGAEKLAEERRQYVLAGLRPLQEQLNKAVADGVTSAEAANKAIEERADLLGQEFDAQNKGRLDAEARARAEKTVNDLIAYRSVLQEQLQTAIQSGDSEQIQVLKGLITEVNGQLRTAAFEAVNMWSALANNPAALAALGMTKTELDAIIAKFKGVAAASQEASKSVVITGEQINNMLADGAAQAFDNFAKAIAEGQNAFKALGDAFRQFASDFLRQIAQMIIKQAIFKALGGAGGAGISLFHSGGVVGGDATRQRTVSPAWFSNAMRYHTGGIAGLAPGEVPAILKKGEEVLTEDDPRHIRNGGGGSSSPMNVKVVNAIDAGDFVSKGLGTGVGEKAILNFIRANSGAVKAALG